MKEWIEYIFAFYIKLFILLLPEFVLKSILRILIPAVKIFLYNRQRLVLQNLSISFPDKSSGEILEIANNVWYNIGWTFVSSIKYIYRYKKIYLKLRFTNSSELSKIEGNSIIVTAHIGNWELLAQRLILEGYKIAAIVRDLRNKLVDREVKKIREKLGGRVFYAHEVRKIIDWLKSGGIAYILPDQHIVEGSVRVEFLGRLAFTTPIITILNKRLSSKIIPMFCIKKDGYYEIIIENEFCPVYTGNLRKDLEYNTLQINKIIEKYVKLYPDQWMWLHRRWKEK